MSLMEPLLGLVRLPDLPMHSGRWVAGIEGGRHCLSGHRMLHRGAKIFRLTTLGCLAALTVSRSDPYNE